MIDPGTSSIRSKRRRIESACSGVEVSWVVRSARTSCGSPATSEIVRFTIRAGAMSSAKRPPLIPDTCLRTVLIAVIGMPDAISSS